ncbi:MAG: hypothetical protein GFH27_549287n283 [Chloroflexi bacterium AL-W]|nr:hypothetical protein [Chloroflexi bacterium AL-N1]NOK66557.1 hypothetical protein [Chloroflexi bacterium AL-N10]NOK71945.1 hypothetical protein [Chloroflexi bacterium AL-N5]NOK81202.1 hypothetical protein [Chloroflexi bacterium AL-W]NOK89475.1 hypothetical protein [Chloroflexi bacterium AL-N15]
MSGIHASDIIVFVLQLYLGFFFLLSALGKLLNLNRFIEGAINYRILPDSVMNVFALALPVVEILISISFIVGFILPITNLFVILLLLIFNLAVLVNLRRGRQISCSCYGLSDSETVSWGTISRNIFLTLLALLGVLLSPMILLPEDLFFRWQENITLFSSLTSVVVLFLLLVFCYVVTQMLERAVYTHNLVRSLQKHA